MGRNCYLCPLVVAAPGEKADSVSKKTLQIRSLLGM